MSDCSTEWKLPKAQDRELGVIYCHPTRQMDDYRAALAIVVCDRDESVRFERVRECENVSDDSEWLLCSNCAAESCVEYWNSGYDAPRYCPNCGARVKEGGDDR